MSLSPIESRSKRIPELKTGVHLVSINDMFYVRNAAKEIIKINGFTGIIIQYKNKEGMHEQLCLLDKGFRQKKFEEVLESAKVPMEEASTPKKADCIGKELYIAIREIHTVDDEKVVMENGDPLIDYQVFKTMPASEGFIPKMKGDPLVNNGIAQDQFVTYKNINTSFVDTANEWTAPNFDIE